MQVYNTMERAVVPFDPKDPERVTIYVCGPTVQSEPHLGHGRSAVAFDVLWRYLEWVGYGVEFVRNVTDVDDKIIDRANEMGLTTQQVAAEAFDSFTVAYDRLGNRRPTIEPKATEHIDTMIKAIGSLIDRGVAYESGGDVYFSVRSFEPYGKLSRHDLDDLRIGDRVDHSSNKHDVLDFALWKAAKPDEPAWDSPWGQGRPGWHIECSAMAAEYLGQPFDIHGGGTDLIFPHHENEIAQAEAATGDTFARYWMHNGMLNLVGEKMSKSTGHVVSLLDGLDRWDPMAIRLFYLRTHYRKPLDFSEDAIGDAEASLERLRAFRRRTVGLVRQEADPEVLGEFRSHMDNDLDVAGALGVIFDTVRNANAAMDRGSTPSASITAVDELLAVLGLDVDAPTDDAVDVDSLADELDIADRSINGLVAARDAARRDRDFARADAIRDGLAERDIIIEDTPDGTRWHRS
ncbi:MAG: cysteine--tRNA ligase [Acidimicrobiia bacterium]